MMIDIFLSYANEDRELVSSIAKRLVSRGYSVWWDHHLVGGAQFRDVIHEQLRAAKAVMVMWTRNSIRSSWVKDEADEALRLNKLIPLRMDELPMTDILLGLRSVHVTAMSDFGEILRTVRYLGKKPSAAGSVQDTGRIMADTTSLMWRYSYEYGLHIVLCFVLAPIFVEIIKGLATTLKVPFDIWVQLFLFFGCLGWSAPIANVLSKRYDSGIFLTIIVFIFGCLLIYIFTPNGPAWEYYGRNFEKGILLFLIFGVALWAYFLFKSLRRGTY
jgi:TIR domain